MSLKISIGFTGTRYGMTSLQKKELRRILEEYKDKGYEFHHGDCVGADSEAHEAAAARKFFTVSHPPVRKGSRAFKAADKILDPLPFLKRNKVIVDQTDFLIGCPHEDFEELKSGTWATIRYARKVGGPRVIILPNGLIRDEEWTVKQRTVYRQVDDTPSGS